MSSAYFYAFLFAAIAVWLLFDLSGWLRNLQLDKAELRMRREKITGQKISKLTASKDRRNQLLRTTGFPLFSFFILTGISVVIGFFAGQLMFSDLFLSVATAAGFLTVPGIYLEIQAGKQKVYEAEKLENALSIITNSFLSSGDIVSSVKENLHLLELRKPFEEFIIDVSYINANIEKGLLRLAAKYPSPFLTQWVDAVLLAQQDRKMMYVLPSIINQMNEARQDQLEANTAMASIWRDYITLLLIICAIPIVFRIVLYDWYAILTTTTIGRGFMMALIAAVLYSLKKATKINRPIYV